MVFPLRIIFSDILDNLHKLVKAGHRVAICEQLENPKLTKTIVKRGVTDLVTPGVALNDEILNQKKNLKPRLLNSILDSLKIDYSLSLIHI